MYFVTFFIICSFPLPLATASVPAQTLNGFYFNVSCESKPPGTWTYKRCSLDRWGGDHNLGPAFIIDNLQFVFDRSPVDRESSCRLDRFKYGLVCAHCMDPLLNFCPINSDSGCFLTVCTNVIESCKPRWDSKVKNIDIWENPHVYNKSLFNQKCGDQQVNLVPLNASSSSTPAATTTTQTTSKGESTTRKFSTSTTSPTTTPPSTSLCALLGSVPADYSIMYRLSVYYLSGVSAATEGSTPTAGPPPADPSSASSTATASTPSRNLMSYLLQEIINRQKQQTKILAGIREDIRKLKLVVSIGQVVNNGRND